MSENRQKAPDRDQIEAVYSEIRRESFVLLQKAYNEHRASVESLNTRSGIALALVGSAVTAANLELWRFHRPPYSPGWSLWLISDIANLVSLFAFALGTVIVLHGLYARARHTPYNTHALNQLGNDTDEAEDFKNLESFHRLQMSKTYQAHEELAKLTKLKADCFNRGITLVFTSLTLIIFSRLIR